ncbi:MAG: hypothetical protein SFW35_05595 [Chitinophagales bacterium]|nr:hypothetical protein [Chitinophagales bacterium]
MPTKSFNGFENHEPVQKKLFFVTWKFAEIMEIAFQKQHLFSMHIFRKKTEINTYQKVVNIIMPPWQSSQHGDYHDEATDNKPNNE